MTEILNFQLPKNQSSIIKVLGVGGGGSNAVTHMYNQGITGVDFIICNTDSQALDQSSVPNKVRLGNRELGAGSKPEIGREAALENIDEIREILEPNTKMVFITAGMGGGTGTGAAPIIAELTKSLDILTVAIVTLPFSFEGRKRLNRALAGIEELRKNVDAILIICNDKLRQIEGDLNVIEAFAKADDILTIAAKGIAEIITVPGLVNVDFEDVKTVMKDSGRAIMGVGVAEGENRAADAITMALASPLLDEANIEGSSSILLNISFGNKIVTMDEIDFICEHVRRATGTDEDEFIYGQIHDKSLEDKLKITFIATGFGSTDTIKITEKPKIEINRFSLNETNNKTTKTNDDEISKQAQITLINKNINNVELEITNNNKLPFEVANNNFSDSIELKKTNTIENNETIQLKSETRKNSGFDFLKKSIIENNDNSFKNKQTELANERVEKLKNFSYDISTPEGLEKIESEPAYLRNKIDNNLLILNDNTKLSEQVIAKDGNTNNVKIKDNSFLYKILPD